MFVVGGRKTQSRTNLADEQTKLNERTTTSQLDLVLALIPDTVEEGEA